MKRISLRNPCVFFLILFLALAAIYGMQWGADTFLDYDDFLVIEPMREVRTLHQYISALFEGRVYDVQPIRDLVTWIDFSLLNWFHISVFHLTNLFIWIGAIFGLRKLVTFAPEEKKNWLLAGILLIAVNPLYVTSVSWLSARKHLLAACFIVWATYYFLEWFNQNKPEKKQLVYAHVFYVLAVFSQPMVIFWPIFAAGLMVLNGRSREWLKLVPLMLIMFGTAYLNSVYYASAPYLKLSYGIPKISDPYNSILSIRLFAIGRYVFQVFIPYWTSLAIYSLSSWRGLTGIFLLPVSFYLFLKTSSKKITFLAYGFFILMLLPVVLRMTQIFGSDTYVITASFGLFFLLVQAVYALFRRQQKLVAAVAVVLFGLMLSLSRERASAFDNDVHAFGEAWRLEESAGTGEDYLHALMHAKLTREAVWHAEAMLRLYPESATAQGVIAHAIENDPELTPAQKIEKIYGYHFFNSYALVILSDLEFTMKNYKNSEDLLIKALHALGWQNVIHGQQEHFAAKIYHRCLLAKDSDCDAKVDEVHQQTQFDWDEAQYQKEKADKNIAQ